MKAYQQHPFVWSDASALEEMAFQTLNGTLLSMPPPPAAKPTLNKFTSNHMEAFMKRTGTSHHQHHVVKTNNTGGMMAGGPSTPTKRTTGLLGGSAKKGVAQTPPESAKKKVKTQHTTTTAAPPLPPSPVITSLFPDTIYTPQSTVTPVTVPSSSSVPAAAAAKKKVATTAPQKRPLVAQPVWSDACPRNDQLIGSRRDKLDLTLKRLSNQNPVDPDLVFGTQNYEIPLKTMFSKFKEAAPYLAVVHARGKSGDWAPDHFDPEEEQEYKAKFTAMRAPLTVAMC
eukprot:PhF_6_TR35709/c0_g1_i1/m.51845